MTRRILLLVAIVIAFSCAACSTSQAASSPGERINTGGVKTAGEYLFTTEKGFSVKDLLSILKEYPVTGTEEVSKGLYLVKLIPGRPRLRDLSTERLSKRYSRIINIKRTKERAVRDNAAVLYQKKDRHQPVFFAFSQAPKKGACERYMDVPPFFETYLHLQKSRKMRGFQNFDLKTDLKKLHGGSFLRQTDKCYFTSIIEQRFPDTSLDECSL
jgi:hypothetical protein